MGVKPDINPLKLTDWDK